MTEVVCAHCGGISASSKPEDSFHDNACPHRCDAAVAVVEQKVKDTLREITATLKEAQSVILDLREQRDKAVARFRGLCPLPDEVDRELDTDLSRTWLRSGNNCHEVHVRGFIEKCQYGAMACCLKLIYRHTRAGIPPTEDEVLPCNLVCVTQSWFCRGYIFKKDRWVAIRKERTL